MDPHYTLNRFQGRLLRLQAYFKIFGLFFWLPIIEKLRFIEVKETKPFMYYIFFQKDKDKAQIHKSNQNTKRLPNNETNWELIVISQEFAIKHSKNFCQMWQYPKYQETRNSPQTKRTPHTLFNLLKECNNLRAFSAILSLENLQEVRHRFRQDILDILIKFLLIMSA